MCLCRLASSKNHLTCPKMHWVPGGPESGENSCNLRPYNSTYYPSNRRWQWKISTHGCASDLPAVFDETKQNSIPYIPLHSHHGHSTSLKPQFAIYFTLVQVIYIYTIYIQELFSKPLNGIPPLFLFDFHTPWTGNRDQHQATSV